MTPYKTNTLFRRYILIFDTLFQICIWEQTIIQKGSIQQSHKNKWYWDSEHFNNSNCNRPYHRSPSHRLTQIFMTHVTPLSWLFVTDVVSVFLHISATSSGNQKHKGHTFWVISFFNSNSEYCCQWRWLERDLWKSFEYLCPVLSKKWTRVKLFEFFT